MKYILIFMLAVCTNYIFADTTVISDSLLNKDSIVKTDTLIHKRVFKLEPYSAPSNPDRMPWIVALIIGISSVIVNIVVAIVQKIANKKNIDSQLTNANDIINKQISNAKDIAILEFNRTVKSRNRQDWINTVRDTCSGLIANMESLNVEFINAKLIGKSADFKLKQKYTIEISQLATKLELLLNPKEEKTILALEYLGKLSNEIIHDRPIDENYVRDEYKRHEVLFLNTIKEILKEEWERVKTGV